MLLGKRPRPSMKRTTSMSEITLDLKTTTEVVKRSGGVGFSGSAQSERKLFVPRNQKKCSLDLVDNHDFLRACSLCKRRLLPGRDIYMYRGDSGFCSLECRQQQMNQDERKEKYLVASKKQVVATPSGSKSKVVTTTTTTTGETIVVAL